MKYKEVAQKNKEELLKILAENKKKIQDVRFKEAVGSVKNVKEIKDRKKENARILTYLNNTK
ncbi:MAG: 50S ribosomal protein L29 [Candidatus Pacebacteria bacterium]|nr:50S ribosomal protein L29 [Candidatus Paceibacterota bacterium]